MATYSNIIRINSEISWVEHVEVFVRSTRQNQYQTKSDTRLDKKGARIVGFFSHQKISDAFVVKQF